MLSKRCESNKTDSGTWPPPPPQKKQNLHKTRLKFQTNVVNFDLNWRHEVPLTQIHFGAWVNIS